MFKCELNGKNRVDIRIGARLGVVEIQELKRQLNASLESVESADVVFNLEDNRTADALIIAAMVSANLFNSSKIAKIHSIGGNGYFVVALRIAVQRSRRILNSVKTEFELSHRLVWKAASPVVFATAN